MRMTILFLVLCFAFIAAAVAHSGEVAAISLTRLRTEFAVEPVAVGNTQPRFSWILESPQRGQRQSGYQVLVSNSPDMLGKDRGDLWDSGKVPSDESAHIEYAGKKLNSRQIAYWKVRVWDAAGNASAWSRPAKFEMALLSNNDWSAKWISQPGGDEPEFSLDDATWIWTNEQNAKGESPSGGRLFRKDFSVGTRKAVKEVWLIAAADDAFTAFLNGEQVASGNSFTTVRAVSVTKHLKPGANILGFIGNNGNGPAALAAILKIQYGDGSSDSIVTDGGWKCAKDSGKDWNTVSTIPSEFIAAKELGRVGVAPWGTPKYNLPSAPSPLLRKEFEVSRKVTKARAYVSALGLYELQLDGKKIGDAYFTPGWTDYHKRVQYQTYDVTNALKKGPHAIGMVLGDGWYCGNVCWFGRNLYGPKPRGLVQLEIEYDDGTKQTVVSDKSWKIATGPILMNDTLMGESYDARLEMPGWSNAGFNDAQWTPAETSDIGDVPVEPQSVALVKKVAELKPKSSWKAPNGATVYDLGQNMVGWVRLKVKGPAGSAVTLRFAEMTSPDKSIYVTNLRSAKQTDTYILKGGGEEVFEPRFTFHGFRYVEVSGYPGDPGMDAIKGIVLSSANMPTGTFECSNSMVSQLQHNIVWGMMGNYLEVPTDCPQRDERLGWMGDAQIFIRTGCFNFDISPFMEKWVKDVRDAQSEQGAYRDVSPNALGANNSGAPAWGDAGIIVPWTVYRCYGDKKILADHFESMKKWIAYIVAENPDFIWRKRSGNNYGDWVSINSDTPKDVLATAYFAHSARLLGMAAGVLGKREEERKFEDLFKTIRDAFNKNFVKEDGRIQGDTQTCYVLALRFDLLSEANRQKAIRYLVEDIQHKRDGHLSTGFVGTGNLAPTLSEMGRDDVAYSLLLKDTFPSWGYSIKNGATTIWERWDGWTDTKGFQDPGMNSFNHYSFGAIGEWMYAYAAGIELDPTVPAYKKFLIQPKVGGGLTWVKASLDSMHGKIESAWRISGNKIALDVTVPANTEADVIVPTSDASKLTENGILVTRTGEVRLIGSGAGWARVRVGGGKYRFEAPKP